jgi:hypothetical protein
MRMLGKSELIFVASPAFATAQRVSLGIDTLSSLPFLSFLEEAMRPTWTLAGPNGATKTISFDPVLRSGDFNILLNAAVAGLGIALLPSEVVEDDIRMMRLVRFLPDWHSEEVDIHLVFATNGELSRPSGFSSTTWPSTSNLHAATASEAKRSRRRVREIQTASWLRRHSATLFHYLAYGMELVCLPETQFV